MKFLLTALSALAFVASAYAQQITNELDPCVMIINGENVPRSEFEYNFRKNQAENVIDKKSLKEYVELFINYKLKVLAAKDAQLDTLTSFKKEYADCRNRIVFPTMITDEDIENEAKNIYNETLQSIGPDGLIKCSHILLTVKADATPEEQQAIKNRIDSALNALANGADFQTLAKNISQDKGSAANGGKIDQWVPHGRFVKEFDMAAFALQKGQISNPVRTQFGWHIIKMDDRKQFEPYEFHRNDILNFIEKRNLRTAIAQNAVEKKAKEQNTTTEKILSEQAQCLSEHDNNTKYMLKEYHDGLLLCEVSDKEVWKKADNDTDGQQIFFKKNKSKYKWDTPRFRGIAYYTKTKADLKEVKTVLKKNDFSKWSDVLKENFNSDASNLRVRAEKGLFKIGTNALVDSIIFKINTTPKMIKDFNYHDVYGKLLKQPDSLEDVKAEVVSDYRDYLEKQWIIELRKKYTVNVFMDEIEKIEPTH
ncbi:MAG: peptidylprolyl isomerase [Bacteroidaceae bacterium]|nr:peptidylprolyl isomerase [Bacteroidaceae bacterium]